MGLIGDVHAMEPCLELGSTFEAEQFTQIKSIVEGCALVVEHNVVCAGDADDEVNARITEQSEQGVHVVLISLSVVGVADIDTHGKAKKFAAEVIFESGTDDLLAVVEVFGTDEADDCVDEEGTVPPCNGIGASLAGLLIDTVMCVGGECATLPSFEVHA